MKFKDLELEDNNHFVAIQYYGLILNRTFLVLLTNDLLVGIKVNGLVSVESSGSMFAKEVSATMTVKGDLQNPYSYIKSKYVDSVKECDLFDGSILKQNKSNFVIKRAEVKNVYYDAKKKWGMGYYPHDGKVYVETFSGKKIEFIILGNQSGQKIVNLILTQ
jgi:hypothetical protein